MVATAGLSLKLDPMRKMFQNASSLKPLEKKFFFVYKIILHLIAMSSTILILVITRGSQ
jgi:hypothetical protein